METNEFLKIIYETEALIEATMSQDEFTDLLRKNKSSLGFGLNKTTAPAYYFHYLMVHFLNNLLGHRRHYYKETFLRDRTNGEKRKACNLKSGKRSA